MMEPLWKTSVKGIEGEKTNTRFWGGTAAFSSPDTESLRRIKRDSLGEEGSGGKSKKKKKFCLRKIGRGALRRDMD